MDAKQALDTANKTNNKKKELEIMMNPILEKIERAANNGQYSVESKFLSKEVIVELKKLGFSIEEVTYYSVGAYGENESGHKILWLK